MKVPSTKHWTRWWRDRQLDWRKSYQNWDHPHRFLISAALTRFHWFSLFEVGVGAGANLINILHHFKDKQLGGCDVNADAIRAATQATANTAILRQGSVEDIMLSDSSTDAVLSDMCLIYVGPLHIRKALREMRRIGRFKVVLCEFHSSSLLKRLWLRYTSGYHAYNYRKLLAGLGFYDINLYKIPERYWPGGEPQQTFGYLITASIPPRK